MKQKLLFVMAAWFIAVVTGYPCTVSCPKGYLGVCVERDGQCKCDCAVDASGGAKALEGLLKGARAKDETIAEAVRRYKEFLDKGIKNFQFDITESGGVLTISNREGTRDNGDVVVQP
jgi:hypothetical protein